MRYGIVSDIHGNLEALEKCLQVFQEKGVDRIANLGDVVGYGADPNRCCDLVRPLADVNVIGNHEAMVIGKLDRDWCHAAARRGIEYAETCLSPENIAWLQSLDYVKYENDICFCHGSPIGAEEFEYVFSLDKAAALTGSFDELSNVTFVGHSHLTTAFLVTDEFSLQVAAPHFKLRSGVKYVFNVGSVGQPRDRDERSCCVIYDTEQATVDYIRVDYDIDRAAAKIMSADLPPAFGQRLYHGV